MFLVIFAFPYSFSPLLNCDGEEGSNFTFWGKTPLSSVSISKGEWNKLFPESMQFEQNNIPLPLMIPPLYSYAGESKDYISFSRGLILALKTFPLCWTRLFTKKNE